MLVHTRQLLHHHSLNACLGCGKDPQMWTDSKSFNTTYWPRTVADNDITTWCQSIGSRITLADSDMMARSLMRRGWTSATQGTGWLVVFKSSTSAKHKWVSVGCNTCSGCHSFALNGSDQIEQFDPWLTHVCGAQIHGVRHA